MSALRALPADGYIARWQTWDGRHDETLTLRWENEGWTAMGEVGRERVHYVIRLSATWQARQFLLFRDLEEPDLWLATDGHQRWGEMNGVVRSELDGCVDIDLLCTPFTSTLPIRRLAPGVGDRFETQAVRIDVETLSVIAVSLHYERRDERRWRLHDPARATDIDFDVDHYGLVLDQPERFRRR